MLPEDSRFVGRDPLTPDERLWRRVPPDRVAAAADDPTRPVPQGNAFRGPSEEEGLSVDRAVVHEQAGSGPQSLLTDDLCNEYWGVVETTVAACEDLCAARVFSDPREDNPAHAEIVPSPDRKKSRKISKSDRCAWVVTPSWPNPHRVMVE